MRRGKFSKDELVTRCFTASFRAVENDEEKGLIEGTPIVFNQDTKIYGWNGDYLERIDSHALDNADLKDIRLFVNHDTSKIALARTKNGHGTMTFNIDDSGLHIKAQLDIENNDEARALYSAIKRGDMDGMSFMFRIDKVEWEGLETDLPICIIKSISIVHEVSVVNFPAYPQTSINARSGEETPTSLLEEARKAYAEETAKKLNGELEIEKLKNKNLINLIK